MKIKVKVIQSHEVIIPATQLQTHMSDGLIGQSLEVPEQKFIRLQGQEFEFRSKKDAMAFIKATGKDRVSLV